MNTINISITYHSNEKPLICIEDNPAKKGIIRPMLTPNHAVVNPTPDETATPHPHNAQTPVPLPAVFAQLRAKYQTPHFATHLTTARPVSQIMPVTEPDLAIPQTPILAHSPQPDPVSRLNRPLDRQKMNAVAQAWHDFLMSDCTSGDLLELMGALSAISLTQATALNNETAPNSTK